MDSKDIKPVSCKENQFLEELMLKLKLQYFVLLMQRADSLEKTLMLEKIDGRRRSRQQRLRCLDGITDSTDMSLGNLWDTVKDREAGVLQSVELQRVRHNLATEQQQTIRDESLVQSLSRVRLFVTPWTACQASLSITSSWILLRLMSIELLMPSNHLILCRNDIL